MSRSLIINARHRLRWHQRLCSDASTVIMWGAWLKLWYPMLRSSAWVADLGVLSGSAGDVQRYAVALVGTSGTLLLWNQLPASKVCAPEVQSLSDYARHFELSEEEILAGRETSVSVVHHDDDGRITRVERRALASRPDSSPIPPARRKKRRAGYVAPGSRERRPASP